MCSEARQRGGVDSAPLDSPCQAPILLNIYISHRVLIGERLPLRARPDPLE